MLRLLVLLLVAAPPAWAASKVRITRAVTVYARPDFESAVAFSLRAGTLISVADKPVQGFKKIRAILGGKKRFGYIPVADLEFHKDMGKRGPWGVGGGLFYSRLAQGSKTFSTSDDVTYSTSEYVSQSYNVAAFFEFGGRDFWRLYGGMRTVEYESKAVLSVPTASDQQIEVGYRFIAVGGQKAWSVFTENFYAGAGLEFAKSISGNAKIGNQDLSSKVEAPDYVMGFAMAGAQYQFQDHWSAFAELRVGAAVNQSPTITVVEFVASAMYWP